MSEISISVTAQEELVLSVLRDLGNGQVEDATGHFAAEFRFKDHGIGLEFKEKQRLAEFFQKTRHSIFRSYVYPIMDQPNITVLTSALVARILVNRDRATLAGQRRAAMGSTLLRSPGSSRPVQ
jgi:choline dehydrogenase-like flavoprotein